LDAKGKGLQVDLSRAEWRTSAGTGSDSDSRVEVAFVEGAVAVRDSKQPGGPILVFTPEEWDAFVAGAKDGEFDLD
jgi:hypothetical protein